MVSNIANTNNSKWFQVLLFNISNSIYQVFLSNTNNLHMTEWFQITNNNNPKQMIGL